MRELLGVPKASMPNYNIVRSVSRNKLEDAK
nr:MAG TPA: hypothetical protein [Caudoviricetes sp.]